MKPAVALVLGLSLFASGCGDGDTTPDVGPGEPRDVGPTPSNGAAGQATAATDGALPRWVEVAEEAGITAMNHSGKPAQKDWIVSGMGGGTICLDYDSDGDMDLLIVDGTMLTSDGVLEYGDDMRTRLYRNDTQDHQGELRFTEVTKEAGIDIQAFGFGGSSCDYDADGHPDVFVATWGRNYLLRNKGDGTFEEVADAAGVRGDDGDMSTASSWGDLDGDGIHDLYVSNYIDQWEFIKYCLESEIPGRHCNWRGFDVYCGPPGLEAQPDRMYFGNGDGTFREVTETHLADQILRYGFTSIMSDVDNDGDLDIYVANDTTGNFLWVNDGTGHFVDRGVESGVASNGDMHDQAGMGVDAADINHDGLIDLTVTNFSHDYNTIYLNQTRQESRPLFRDASHTFNVARLSYERLCWGTKFFDMDCDGDLDKLTACGHVYGEIDNFAKETGTTYEQQVLLLRNTGGPRYRMEDVTDASGPALQVRRVWRGATFGDYDDDGDVDVFLTSLNGKPGLFRNDGGNDNNFLRFRLQGEGMQRDPSGARVYVTLADGRRIWHELHHGASFCSDNDPRLFFGTGQETVVPRVEVVWRTGEPQVFENVETRRMYRVEQGRDELLPDEPSAYRDR